MNLGCVPKKVMFYASTTLELAKHAQQFGISCDPSFDFAALKKKREDFIQKVRRMQHSRFEDKGITYVYGAALFINHNTIEVGNQQYTAPHILLAVGGRPRMPSIEGAEYAISSDGVFELSELPARIAIVGAGYIGVEMTGIFNGFGSEAHLFMRHDTVLEPFDVRMKAFHCESPHTVAA